MIIDSINKWEPRIVVNQIEVSSKASREDLNPYDTYEDIDNVLSIKIIFVDPDQISEVQELRLQIPLT